MRCMSTMRPALPVEPPPTLGEDLLRRFDAPGPRYTSYPTADRFVEAFGPADTLRALGQRALGAALGSTLPL